MRGLISARNYVMPARDNFFPSMAMTFLLYFLLHRNYFLTMTEKWEQNVMCLWWIWKQKLWRITNIHKQWHNSNEILFSMSERGMMILMMMMMIMVHLNEETLIRRCALEKVSKSSSSSVEPRKHFTLFKYSGIFSMSFIERVCIRKWHSLNFILVIFDKRNFCAFFRWIFVDISFGR